MNARSGGAADAPIAPYDAHVVVATDRFDDDIQALTGELGFRVDTIFPADSPNTAVVSGHGIRLRLEASDLPDPITLRLITPSPGPPITLPGGSRIECHDALVPYHLPENDPSLVVTHDDGEVGIGRAGMSYRDLIPGRWGGRFIASLISIPEGGPVPDYVHFHKIRFQLIFVKSGWVRVAYEGQGDPLLLRAGDCVTQPPEIRHRVLESSPGLEVVEVGCPAEHETIADWAHSLPDEVCDDDREWDGQRFVHHVAANADYQPWRAEGWEYRETGVSAGTDGLAGVRVARPAPTAATTPWIAHDTEFSLLVTLTGAVTFEAEGRPAVLLDNGSSVAIPGGLPYRLRDPSDDCQLLDVTLPA
jgi:quercetin dioxygenase-like cupin family protein